MDLPLIRKPLPSSTSIAFLQHPITFVQWNSALRRVKALYLRGLLKQCSDRCNQLLFEGKKPPHPVHATYLHFYSALSTEGMGRLTHNLSISKLPMLKTAMASYEAAALSLPVAESTTYDHIFQNNDTSSERSFSTFNASVKTTTPSPSRPGSPICSSSPSSVDSRYSIDDYKDIRRPSPLRINKPANSYSNPVSDTNEPSTPVPRIPHSPSITSIRPSSITFSESASTWLKSRAHDRYNVHLTAFAEMLAAHIEVVKSLISAAEETQGNRYTARRLISYGSDGEARAEDMRDRIVKLRERGWKREPFAPERYMNLCAKALSELSTG